MRHFTNDLYEKYCSGFTISEISEDTGISKQALYQRFHRLRKPLQDESTDIKVEENPVPVVDKEAQLESNKWQDKLAALIVLTSVLIGFFIYRKYYSQRQFEETK